jgi:chaperonin cofactor prefoldin
MDASTQLQETVQELQLIAQQAGSISNQIREIENTLILLGTHQDGNSLFKQSGGILVQVDDKAALVEELKEGLSFKEVSIKHSTDTETLESKGYLGEFMLTDLPDYLSSEIVNLKINEISKIIKSSDGYHITSIIGKTDDTVSSFKDLKDTIMKDYKKETGTRKYFDLIDDISEMNFTKKYRLQELADRFNVKIVSSKYISKDEGHGIFDYEFVRTGIFTDDVIINSKTSDLIYLNGDRFIADTGYR